MHVTNRMLALLAGIGAVACASNTPAPETETVRTRPAEIEVLEAAPGSNYVFLSNLHVTHVVLVSGGPREQCGWILMSEGEKVHASAVVVLQFSTEERMGAITCDGAAYGRKK